MVVFGQSGCFGEKVVVFVQNCFYSVKSGCIWEKLLCSGILVVFGHAGCIRAKWLYSG